MVNKFTPTNFDDSSSLKLDQGKETPLVFHMVAHGDDNETRCLNVLVNFFENFCLKPEERVRILNYINERYNYLYEIGGDINIELKEGDDSEEHY